MKKRLYIILFTLIFSTMCVMPAFAQNEMAAYVVDDAGLLTDSEENSLKNFKGNKQQAKLSGGSGNYQQP